LSCKAKLSPGYVHANTFTKSQFAYAIKSIKNNNMEGEVQIFSTVKNSDIFDHIFVRVRAGTSALAVDRLVPWGMGFPIVGE
jgi:hypothetical protein